MKYSDLLKSCRLCNRFCGINRLEGQLGVCKANDKVKIARAALHKWEEPPITGKNGSGTVFFSHCNLKCVFCQNHEISQEYNGAYIEIKRLSEIFLELQQQGAANINLVTPTHYIPQIIEAIEIARANGLILPIVYNTNGYDSLEAIKLLDGYIDIYLPDFKYFNDKYSKKYSKVSNYEKNIIPLLREMINQVGTPTFNKEGILQKGVIIRHLMLPGLLFDSKRVIDEIFNNFGSEVYISLMNQYTPLNKVSDYPEINKHLNPKHYESLVNYAIELGITQGFIQEDGTNSSVYVPDFSVHPK